MFLLKTVSVTIVGFQEWYGAYSVMSDSLQLHELQPARPSVHGICQAKHWSGLPFPAPGDLPDPGVEPASSAL